MKKATGLFGAVLLAGGIVAGCSADSENPAPAENSTENTATETEQTGEAVEQEAQEGTNEAEQAAENAGQEAEEAADAAGEAIEEEAQQVPENAENLQEQVELPSENYEAGEDGSVGSSSSETEVVTSGTEATGTFNGLVDPHTVELQVDGQPTAYQVDPESDIMNQFEAMNEGDSVTFTYVEEGPQLVITELK